MSKISKAADLPDTIDGEEFLHHIIREALNQASKNGRQVHLDLKFATLIMKPGEITLKNLND